MSHGQGQAWASPAPAAMAALGVVAIGMGASMLGKVPVEALPVLAGWIFGGFLIQFVTGIIELKDGHLVGGNVMMFFSAFFMLATAIGMIAKFFLISNGIAPSPAIEGYLWASGALYLTLLMPTYLKQNALIFSMIAFVCVLLWMIVGMDTGWFGSPAVFKPILGYGLIAVGLGGNYLAGAILLNATFGKSILPIPGPILKDKA